MKNFDWYLREYGEDWAQIVYDEDLKENKRQSSLHSMQERILKNANRPASYMTDGINE